MAFEYKFEIVREWAICLFGRRTCQGELLQTGEALKWAPASCVHDLRWNEHRGEYRALKDTVKTLHSLQMRWKALEGSEQKSDII